MPRNTTLLIVVLATLALTVAIGVVACNGSRLSPPQKADRQTSAERPTEGRSQGGSMMTQLSGRWVSTEHVTFTNPARAGSSFFLDVVIAEDGTFQGAWDEYSCISYPGPYSTMIISCSRVQRPAKARGKFNVAARSGEIELDGLGRSSFAYGLDTELLLELPKDWLKQGDPVLYTSKLVRASK